MNSNQQGAPDASETQLLRQQAGRWLKQLREDAGMSQRELAKAVGFDYYTFISQLEGGRGRLPQGQYAAFAQALNVPLRDFVKVLTRYYDPITYHALFDGTPEALAPTAPSPAESSMDALAARLARLEAMVANKPK